MTQNANPSRQKVLDQGGNGFRLVMLKHMPGSLDQRDTHIADIRCTPPDFLLCADLIFHTDTQQRMLPFHKQHFRPDTTPACQNLIQPRQNRQRLVLWIRQHDPLAPVI